MPLRCSRCQADLDPDLRVCPECGAPLAPGANADLPEPIHQALARANLLRVRGEYHDAEQACLSVLRKLPHCSPAHTLLGDIALDQNNFEEAERWYELALDLDPESAADRRRLEEIQQRRTSLDTATTVRELGLDPSDRFDWRLIAVGALALGTMAVLIAAALRPAEPPQVIRPSVPLSAPADSVAQKLPVADRNTPVPTVNEPPKPVEVAASDDDTLLREIAASSVYGTSIIKANHDPRDGRTTVTFTVEPLNDPRKISAEIARRIFETRADTVGVTLRAMSGPTLTFMADASRAKFLETQTPAWQQANGTDAEAFANFLLERVWTTASPVPSRP